MLDFVVHTLHRRVAIPLKTTTQSLEVRVAISAVKFIVGLVGVNHQLVPTYQVNLPCGLQERLGCLSLVIRL